MTSSIEDPFYLLEKWLKVKEFIVVGKSVRRADAIDKVTGKARFLEDYVVPNMLYAKPILSDVPHALLKGVVTDEALKIPKVIDVVTAKDIPGENQVGYALPDQPLFPEKKIRFHGEPLGLILAEEPEKALSQGVRWSVVVMKQGNACGAKGTWA